MPKIDPASLTYPSYPAGSRPALALKAFKSLLAERNGKWCRENQNDWDILVTRTLDTLGRHGITIGAQKARTLAARIVNETYHTSRKPLQSKRLNVDKLLLT